MTQDQVHPRHRGPCAFDSIALTLLFSAAAGCQVDTDAPSLLRHCQVEEERAAREFTLTEEWVVGGIADSTVQLSPPLIFPSPAPRGGLSFALAYQAPIITLDSDGSIRSEIGRSGSGPGEWSSTGTRGVAWYEDALWVVQAGPARVHTFSEAGEILGTRLVQPPAEGPIDPLRVLRNGALIAAMPARIEGGGQRLVRWMENTGMGDSIGIFQANFSYRVVWPSGGITVGIRPMNDHLLEAIAPDGRSIVLVDRPAAPGIDPAEFRIRRIGEDGEDLVDRTVCYFPSPVPVEHASDTIGRLVGLFAPREPGIPTNAVEEIVREAVQLPGYWPPVTQVVASTSDEIWLRREVREDGQVPWEIRDFEGHLTGILLLPSDVRILAVDRDVVWTEWYDSFDVPVVARNRLVPG